MVLNERVTVHISEMAGKCNKSIRNIRKLHHAVVSYVQDTHENPMVVHG